MNNESDTAKWAKYLQYLRDWAESHSAPRFIGCCPACYQEWLDAEYLEEGSDGETNNRHG